MDAELLKIQKQFNEVISYSQGIPNPNTDKLFKKWVEKKRYIRHELFNDKLIYSSPDKISFELDEDSKVERKNAFVNYTAKLISYDSQYGDFIRYLDRLSTSDLYNNLLSNDYTISDEKTIKSGTRVVKSFKYFIQDDKLLNDIQSKASELIQENKIEGYLTFSIHPLDFLSISENTFNWRSCHALDGEYRAGNLSYMVDSATVICYLSNGNEYKLPNFPDSVPWNSKKWRCLLYFDDQYEALFAGRQYPFFSPGALEKVREVFCQNLVPDVYSRWSGTWVKPDWSHWHNDYIKEFHYEEHDTEDGGGYLLDEGIYFVMTGRVYNIKDTVIDCDTPLHFNDVLRSSYYDKPYYMFKRRCFSNDRKFIIGGRVPCLHCGKEIVEESEIMVCNECILSPEVRANDELYPTCDCCGNRYRVGDGHYIDEEHICSHCYETETFVCDDCGEACYNNEKHWVEEKQMFMCDYCFEEYEKQKSLKTVDKNTPSNITLGPGTLTFNPPEDFIPTIPDEPVGYNAYSFNDNFINDWEATLSMLIGNSNIAINADTGDIEICERGEE